MQEQWEHRAALAHVGLLTSQGEQAVLHCAEEKQGAAGPQHVQGDSSRSLLQLYLTPMPAEPQTCAARTPDSAGACPEPLIPYPASCGWVRRTLGDKRRTVG